MQETWIQSLGQKDSPGEGNGNPLQYSCLENSMDGEIYSPQLQSMGSQRVGHNCATNTHHQQKDFNTLKAWAMVNVF